MKLYLNTGLVAFFRINASSVEKALFKTSEGCEPTAGNSGRMFIALGEITDGFYFASNAKKNFRSPVITPEVIFAQIFKLILRQNLLYLQCKNS